MTEEEWVKVSRSEMTKFIETVSEEVSKLWKYSRENRKMIEGLRNSLNEVCEHYRLY